MDSETRSKISPETSKSNPKHIGYEKYMQQRGLFDRIRDEIRNFIDEKVNKSDVSEEIVLEDNEENSQHMGRLVAGRIRRNDGNNTLDSRRGQRGLKNSFEDIKFQRIKIL